MLRRNSSTSNVIVASRVANSGGQLANSSIHNMSWMNIANKSSVLDGFITNSNTSLAAPLASTNDVLSAGTMAMGILLLVFCLPAAASNLANALFLYKKRPLSARYVALLGSSSSASRRAPQELLLLNLSCTNVILILACFIVVGAGTLQASLHHGLTLTPVVLTMMLEFITCTLLTMRNALLMLVAYERFHSSRHSLKHVGILEEQLIFQRSLWIAWIVGASSSLVDCIIKYSVFGVHVVQQQQKQQFSLFDEFHLNHTENYDNMTIFPSDFAAATTAVSGTAINRTAMPEHSMRTTALNATYYCYSFSSALLWWNWTTFGLRYVLPTFCCIALSVIAINNYFRALRAAIRSLVTSSSTSANNNIALQPKRHHQQQQQLQPGRSPRNLVVHSLPNGVSASLDALKQKRARVYRASLKLGLFLLGSVIFTTVLFGALLRISLHWPSPSTIASNAATQNTNDAVLDCRAIAIPNYIIMPNASDFSSLPWLLTFLMLCSTMLDPIAIGLSYSITSLATFVAQQQQRQQQNGQQQYNFTSPSLPQHQRSALGELLYKLYVWIILYGGAWLQVVVFERVVHVAQLIAQFACPARMFQRQQNQLRQRTGQRRQARTVSLIAAGGGGFGGVGANGGDLNLAELQYQQQQYQHMMQFMQPPQPYQNHQHHHHQALRPNNNNNAPFFHIAVQQQQRLRVMNANPNQNNPNKHQQQMNNRQILLTIENYINVSQVHHHHHPFSQIAADGKTQSHPEIQLPPQQIQLLMPNDVSDIGDLMRPGSSAVPHTTRGTQGGGGGDHSIPPSATTTPTFTKVTVEQLPHFVASSSGTGTNTSGGGTNAGGFCVANASDSRQINNANNSAQTSSQQQLLANSRTSSNQINIFTTTTMADNDHHNHHKMTDAVPKTQVETPEPAPHPFQFGHHQPVWATSVVEPAQFVRLGEAQRVPFAAGSRVEVANTVGFKSNFGEHTSAAAPRISRLPSLSESF